MKLQLFSSILLIASLLACSEIEPSCFGDHVKSDGVCPCLELLSAEIDVEDEYLILSLLANNNSPEFFFHTAQKTYTDFKELEFTKLASIIDLSDNQVENLFAKNNSSAIWGELFSNNLNWINPNQVDCYFENGNGWKNYFDQFNSQGILSFSRPLIYDSNKAIIAYTHLCGFLCGTGHVAYLEKIGDEWSLIHHEVTWIS